MEKKVRFSSAQDFEKWLAKNHSTSTGIWLRMYRKGSTVKSVKGPEALDIALCYGWITGQASSDSISTLWRVCPRRPKSIWSKLNTQHAERLIKEGRMKPPGFAQIEAAKKDGRWGRAYHPQSTAKMPRDFMIALNRNSAARAFFDTLNRQNKYAIIFRLHNTVDRERRKRKIAQFVGMLAERKVFHF